MAAVLGNASNRAKFRKVFWWDREVGLSTYLAEAAGSPQQVEEVDAVTGKITTHPPRIITQEIPPRGHAEALTRWKAARTRFRMALQESQSLLDRIKEGEKLTARVATLATDETKWVETAGRATEAATQAQLAGAEAAVALSSAERERHAARDATAKYQASAPSFMAKMLRTEAFRTWRAEGEQYDCWERDSAALLATCEAALVQRGRELDKCRNAAAAAASALAAVRSELVEARRKLAAVADRLGIAVDAAFLTKNRAAYHRCAPWLEKSAHKLRDNVFVAAIALHRAFLDAAAKPLRHNIGALMATFVGRPLTGAAKEILLKDLWCSLFLVVPVVSTTFASVERMLGRLPPEALGWLLIDEAGQASPQAAVGALMRTRRAVVVGDPMQIEPVVMLPSSLTSAICSSFGVDPDLFDAPSASAQTLADAATPYTAEFHGRNGSRTVGVPLLVHRRCAEPMFGISNAIAYDQQMVSSKTPSPSPIRDLLGPSRWFHVEGTAEDKWCPQEGRLAMDLLGQLLRSGMEPSLYVITPFVVVQDRLRRLVLDTEALNGTALKPEHWVRERIGTVHTVQGREAEAVILVLGAPLLAQTGARSWAGGRPNLLNVAVTRAKEVLYVVGNRTLWREAGVFRDLSARMP